MRRSTAAAIGTFTGAALIMGVRLSVAAPPQAAPPSFDLSQAEAGQSAAAGGEPSPKPSPSRKGRERQADEEQEADGAGSAEDDTSGGDGGGDESDDGGRGDESGDGGPGDESGNDGGGGEGGNDGGRGDEGGDSDEESTDEPPRDSNGLNNGRFTGQAVSNPYGRVQVAITVSGGRITAVAASTPTTGLSAGINSRAVPQLKEQTLDSQSAEVDAVSGATFTSQSYAESLQGALDAARG